MPVQTLPLNHELVIYAGTTLHKEYRWYPEGGTTPVDFTGWTAVMLIGVAGEEALYELTTGNGAMQLTGDGRIIFELAPADTTGLLGKVNLAYQVDLTDHTGYVIRFLHGRVTVTRDVLPMS